MVAGNWKLRARSDASLIYFMCFFMLLGDTICSDNYASYALLCHVCAMSNL